MSTSETTKRPNRSARLTSKQVHELIEAGRVYYPPSTGLHICGSDDLHNCAVTVASFPMSEPAARAKYDQVRRDFEETDADDVVVDLIVNDSLVDNFSIRRQMVDRVRRECEAP